MRVSCMQLGNRYSTNRARQIVQDWVEPLGSTPTPLIDLEFVTRTPKRLFAALEGQPQLRRLTLKWGDYQDLTVLESLKELRHLELRGAAGVTDLQPLGALTSLEGLAIEGFRQINDASPIANLTRLTDLELGGDWMTPRNAHIGSIAFLKTVPKLESLLFRTIIVDDLDYLPLLSLPSLRSIRVMSTRNMNPTYEHLKMHLPGQNEIGRFRRCSGRVTPPDNGVVNMSDLIAALPKMLEGHSEMTWEIRCGHEDGEDLLVHIWATGEVEREASVNVQPSLEVFFTDFMQHSDVDFAYEDSEHLGTLQGRIDLAIRAICGPTQLTLWTHGETVIRSNLVIDPHGANPLHSGDVVNMAAWLSSRLTFWRVRRSVVNVTTLPKTPT